MVWEPYALAVIFGLIVSGTIYFIVMWPQVAPDDETDDQADDDEAANVVARVGLDEAPAPAEPASTADAAS